VQEHADDPTAQLSGTAPDVVLTWEDPPGTPHAAHVGNIPGSADWDLRARLRLIYSAIAASSVSGTPTYVDSLADTTHRAVQAIAQRVGGAVIPGDSAPQGTRGHLVIDPSDEELNLSAVVE
jgi:hypothetical protein